jgi:hypothetical protein
MKLKRFYNGGKRFFRFFIFLGKSLLKIVKGIKKFFMFIFKSLIKFFITIGFSLTVIVGVGVILRSLFLSFQLIINPFPAASNLIASAGGCIGVLLIMLVYSENKAKRKVREALAEKRHEDTKRELEEVRKERENLEKELEKQKNNMQMYAGINLINPIRHIALLEITIALNKPRQETLKSDAETTGILFGKRTVEEREEYKSLLIGMRTERLGIDLEKIRVVLQGDSIFVSGVECIRIGTNNIKTEWYENRITRLDITKKGKGKIVSKSNQQIIAMHEKLGELMKEDIKIIDLFDNQIYDTIKGWDRESRQGMLKKRLLKGCLE